MKHDDPFDHDDSPKKGSPILLIGGIAAGVLFLSVCCCGVGVGGFFAIKGAGAPDIVGRWENDDLTKLILDFRADGTGTFEVPLARVRIPITYKLDGDELKIKAAPGQGLQFGEREAMERLEHTRVSRTGNELRMDALSGPGRGQAMLLKKIG